MVRTLDADTRPTRRDLPLAARTQSGRRPRSQDAGKEFAVRSNSPVSGLVSSASQAEARGRSITDSEDAVASVPGGRPRETLAVRISPTTSGPAAITRELRNPACRTDRPSGIAAANRFHSPSSNTARIVSMEMNVRSGRSWQLRIPRWKLNSMLRAKISPPTSPITSRTSRFRPTSLATRGAGPRASSKRWDPGPSPCQVRSAANIDGYCAGTLPVFGARRGRFVPKGTGRDRVSAQRILMPRLRCADGWFGPNARRTAPVLCGGRKRSPSTWICRVRPLSGSARGRARCLGGSAKEAVFGDAPRHQSCPRALPGRRSIAGDPRSAPRLLGTAVSAAACLEPGPKFPSTYRRRRVRSPTEFHRDKTRCGPVQARRPGLSVRDARCHGARACAGWPSAVPVNASARCRLRRRKRPLSATESLSP